MYNKKLRVGVIGANPTMGWSPRAHMPALVALPEIDLIAVCTTREASARKSAEKYNVPMWFDNHQAMLQEADLDAVAVSVKVPDHYNATVDAIEAGIHVYTEWPLGRHLEEAVQMAHLASAKEIHTLVGLQGQCHPAYIRLKELVDEGFTGDILSVKLSQVGSGILSRTSDRTWQRDVNLGANTFTISFGHLIDSMCMCLGEPKEVSAIVSTQVRHWHEIDTGRMLDVTSPDNVLVNGFLENGAVFSAHVSVAPWLGSNYSLEVYGRDGTLTLNSSGEHPQLGELTLRGGKSSDSRLEKLPIPQRLTWVPASVPNGPPFNVAQMWSRFATAIRTDTPIGPDFAWAVRRHQLIETIHRAAETGQRLVV